MIRTPVVGGLVVAAAVAGLAGEAAAGNERWPWPVDWVREHAWWVLAPPVAVGALPAVATLLVQCPAGDEGVALRGLASFGQGYDCQLMRRVATRTARRATRRHAAGTNHSPTQDKPSTCHDTARDSPPGFRHRRDPRRLLRRPGLPWSGDTALEAHARTHPDTGVLRWSTERDLFVLGEPDDTDPYPRPDAIVTWHEGTHRVTATIEYDTGTERLRRLTDKLALYTKLFAPHARHLRTLVHVHDDPILLFAFTTPGREATARTALTHAHPDIPVATGVWKQGISPAGPLWLPLGARPPRLRLAQLGAAATTPPAPDAAPGRPRPTTTSTTDAWFDDDEPW